MNNNNNDLNKIWKTAKEIFCLGKIDKLFECGWASTVSEKFEDWNEISYLEKKLFGYCESCYKNKLKWEKQDKLVATHKKELTDKKGNVQTKISTK